MKCITCGAKVHQLDPKSKDEDATHWWECENPEGLHVFKATPNQVKKWMLEQGEHIDGLAPEKKKRRKKRKGYGPRRLIT